MNGRRSSKALRVLNWHSFSLPCGPLVVHSGLKLCLYWTLAKRTLLAITTKCKKSKMKKDTNLLLHLFHLHLAPLVVGLVESQLSLGASQFVLRLLQLVLQIGREVHIMRRWWLTVKYTSYMRGDRWWLSKFLSPKTCSSAFSTARSMPSALNRSIWGDGCLW